MEFKGIYCLSNYNSLDATATTCLGGDSAHAVGNWLATPACPGEPAPRSRRPARSATPLFPSGRSVEAAIPHRCSTSPASALVPAPGHEYLHHSNRLWPGGHILELLHDAQRVGVYFPFVAQLAADTLSRWFRGLAKCNTLAIPSGSRGVLLALVVWPVGYFSAIVAHLGRII